MHDLVNAHVAFFVTEAFRGVCMTSCIFYAWLLTKDRGNKSLPWGLKFRGNNNSIPKAYRGNRHVSWELGVETRSHENQETKRKIFKTPNKNQPSRWFQKNIERYNSWIAFGALAMSIWWFQKNIERIMSSLGSWNLSVSMDDFKRILKDHHANLVMVGADGYLMISKEYWKDMLMVNDVLVMLLTMISKEYWKTLSVWWLGTTWLSLQLISIEYWKNPHEPTIPRMVRVRRWFQ